MSNACYQIGMVFSMNWSGTVYVSRGTLIQENDGRTNDDREKDVVPQ